VPANAPVDELVRVEQDDSEHDRESDDRHDANVALDASSGLVSGTVLSHSGADRAPAMNPGAGPRIEGDVTAAADVLPFLRARPTGPHMPQSETRREQVSDVARRDASDVDDVVSRAAAGEAEAFRTLFLRHKSDVARLVYRMLNAPADLEDVIQEVFVQVFRSLKDFRGQAKFSTWLHRVTVNVVLMHRRSARSRPVLTEELPGEIVADDHQTQPDDEVDRRERMRAFQRLLSRLADKKRIVFVLHELEGMAPAEIAEVVGAPVLTVRTRLFYARRELEAMLAEEPTLAPFAGLATPEAGGAS
jgi:RNA polymerase sigma-70 factor (ECF subfamily)